MVIAPVSRLRKHQSRSLRTIASALFKFVSLGDRATTLVAKLVASRNETNLGDLTRKDGHRHMWDGAPPRHDRRALSGRCGSGRRVAPGGQAGDAGKPITNVGIGRERQLGFLSIKKRAPNP